VASANVELVRSLFADWERGDWGSTAWADPEIEFVIADGPAPRTWVGVAGMAEGYREFLATWEGFRTEATDYRELDDERVLVLVQLSGLGKSSGLALGEMQPNAAAVMHVRDGRLTKITLYWHQDRALTNLGLTPEPD
jgi:ketosteroid isomerase-like protein